MKIDYLLEERSRYMSEMARKQQGEISALLLRNSELWEIIFAQAKQIKEMEDDKQNQPD